MLWEDILQMNKARVLQGRGKQCHSDLDVNLTRFSN